MAAAHHAQVVDTGCDGVVPPPAGPFSAEVALGAQADPDNPAARNLYGLRVDINGSLEANAGLNARLNLARNPARLDSVTLWGNYATSDAYRLGGDEAVKAGQ